MLKFDCSVLISDFEYLCGFHHCDEYFGTVPARWPESIQRFYFITGLRGGTADVGGNSTQRSFVISGHAVGGQKVFSVFTLSPVLGAARRTSVETVLSVLSLSAVMRGSLCTTNLAPQLLLPTTHLIRAIDQRIE
jgi:hypothetical protein